MSIAPDQADLVFPKSNFLTIDIEDWYRLMGQYFGTHREPSAVAFERQIDIILEIFSRFNCQATFFILGSSTHDRPHIVKKIAAAGHEIASHGWGHECISNIGLDAFRRDLERSINWLEDLTGRKILGYRAPRFSVAPEQLDGFLEICLDCGLVYDSSIFPISGWRYGIPGALVRPRIIRERKERRLVEFPIATVRWLGRTWPVGGGGWWRVLPYPVIRWAFNAVEQHNNSFMTYFHPYEFDSEPLVAKNVVKLTPRVAFWSFSQNLGQQTTRRKLEAILKEKQFISVEAYLKGIGLI